MSLFHLDSLDEGDIERRRRAGSPRGSNPPGRPSPSGFMFGCPGQPARHARPGLPRCRCKRLTAACPRRPLRGAPCDSASSASSCKSNPAMRAAHSGVRACSTSASMRRNPAPVRWIIPKIGGSFSASAPRPYARSTTHADVYAVGRDAVRDTTGGTTIPSGNPGGAVREDRPAEQGDRMAGRKGCPLRLAGSGLFPRSRLGPGRGNKPNRAAGRRHPADGPAPTGGPYPRCAPSSRRRPKLAGCRRG